MQEQETKYDPVKEFLRSAIEARIDIRRHKKRVAELDAQCARLVAKMNGMPGGGGDDHSHEQMWNQLAEERAAELRAMKRAEEQKEAVEDFISHLPCAIHRSILKLKYADDKNWPQVLFALYEEGVYYSERQLYRHHGDALQEARALWRQGGPWKRNITEEENEKERV